MQSFRAACFDDKSHILAPFGLAGMAGIPVTDTEYVERDFLIKDTWNSFSFPYGQDIPSFFHQAGLPLTLGDMLTNRLGKKFNFPRDRPVMLHLVVDFSRSMDSQGKLDLAVDTVNRMVREWESLLKDTVVRIYAFSDTCRPSDYPLGTGGIVRGETNYGSFIKKVLHLRDRERHNKIILLTDGLPSDWSEAMRLGALLPKNRVDYTQIIFQAGDELRHEVRSPGGFSAEAVVDDIIFETDDTMERITLSDEALAEKRQGVFERFTDFAETCGGNQIILNVNRLLRIVAVECYDRYLGALSLVREQPFPEKKPLERPFFS